MDRSLQVAHIIDLLNIGGAQKQLVVFATQAHKYGIDLTIISLGEDNDLTIEKELRSLGIRIVKFPAPKLLNVCRIGLLLDFLRKEKFDIVHTHLTHANILGSICGYLVGVPVVSTLHSTGHVEERVNPVKDTLEICLLRYLTKRLIAVGYKVEENHRIRFKSKEIDIISNAVSLTPPLDAHERLRIRTEIAGDPTLPIIITVGRLAPPKGYHDLLFAFADFHACHPEALLAIVGDGPLFQDIQAQVSDLQLISCVRLLGSREDVTDLLAASDIYVSSSIWEGMPMAVLEGIMAGLPVIATDVGDIPRVVIPEIGIIVPSRQPRKIAEALDRLICKPELRRQMGTAAREHAIKNYSADVWMDKVLHLYREVLNN